MLQIKTDNQRRSFRNLTAEIHGGDELLSAAAYSSISTSVSSPSSGSGENPLSHWLYDTYLSSHPNLRLVILSYIPIVSAIYLRRVHHPDANGPVSFSGFEAVNLAIYSTEIKARNRNPVMISIPNLSQPSLCHSPHSQVKSSNASLSPGKPMVGVLSPPLELQMAVKSTKRATIVGVVLDYYYKQISQMPSWSKLDFCKFATVWAREKCPCTSEFDHKPNNFLDWHENGDEFRNDITVEADEVENMGEKVKDLDIVGEKDAKIPLPWELLQPISRISGHCLMGPLNVDEVKDEASIAVRHMYARASHDLVPQAILAMRSLIQLDKRAREADMIASVESVNSSGSNANMPSKARKPEILLVSK